MSRLIISRLFNRPTVPRKRINNCVYMHFPVCLPPLNDNVNNTVLSNKTSSHHDALSPSFQVRNKQPTVNIVPQLLLALWCRNGVLNLTECETVIKRTCCKKWVSATSCEIKKWYKEFMFSNYILVLYLPIIFQYIKGW